MQAYIYAADIYCKSCGEAIRERLRKEGNRPKTWRDESTYDSDEFPKGPFDDGGGECDQPQHCGNHAECLEAIEIDGIKHGAWLENPLTSDGIDYVNNQYLDSPDNPVCLFWLSSYSDHSGIIDVDKLTECAPELFRVLISLKNKLSRDHAVHLRPVGDLHSEITQAIRNATR